MPIRVETQIALDQLHERMLARIRDDLSLVERNFARLMIGNDIAYFAACTEAGFLFLEDLEVGASLPEAEGIKLVMRRLLVRNGGEWPVLSTAEPTDLDD